MGELGTPPLVSRLIVALGYPLGFVICLTSGAELFTEHTATAVYPILDRKAPFGRLIRLWGVVAIGNLVGAFLSAGLLTLAEPVIGAREGYVEVGRHLVSFESMPVIINAVLAGWLMALGAWLILATPPTVSQLVSIYIVTFLIGMGGLHHSIAGSAEVFTVLPATWLAGACSWPRSTTLTSAKPDDLSERSSRIGSRLRYHQTEPPFEVQTGEST